MELYAAKQTQLFGSAVKTGHISKSGKEKMLPRTEKQPLTSVEESPSWIQKKKQQQHWTIVILLVIFKQTLYTDFVFIAVCLNFQLNYKQNPQRCITV